MNSIKSLIEDQPIIIQNIALILAVLCLQQAVIIG